MPCKTRMVGCRRDCLHRQLVNEYRAARAAAEAEQEAACLGYATEEREYGPIVTFKTWLEDMAGSRQLEQAS